MAKPKSKKRGPKKGVPKPHKRPLDGNFLFRLRDAMRRGGFFKPDGNPANSELAKKAGCSRQVIGQYLSENAPRTSIDARLLLDLCDVLSVTPYWLMKNEGTIDDVELHRIPFQDVRKKITARRD